MHNRRALVFTALGLPLALRPAVAQDNMAAHLRSGGVVLLLRHAQTDPGVGDPPGFKLGDCGTQRNLSAAGRAQAAALGAWFKTQGLQPAAVKSSAWCRCIDTATLAFGQAEPWAALNSFFDSPGVQAAQTEQLRAGLAGVARSGFEVWVTHMVNIGALSGESVAMGEGLVLRAASGEAHNLGRLRLPG